jgi:hypothetical protein
MTFICMISKHRLFIYRWNNSLYIYIFYVYANSTIKTFEEIENQIKILGNWPHFFMKVLREVTQWMTIEGSKVFKEVIRTWKYEELGHIYDCEGM